MSLSSYHISLAERCVFRAMIMQWTAEWWETNGQCNLTAWTGVSHSRVVIPSDQCSCQGLKSLVRWWWIVSAPSQCYCGAGERKLLHIIYRSCVVRVCICGRSIGLCYRCGGNCFCVCGLCVGHFVFSRSTLCTFNLPDSAERRKYCVLKALNKLVHTLFCFCFYRRDTYELKCRMQSWL